MVGEGRLFLVEDGQDWLGIDGSSIRGDLCFASLYCYWEVDTFLGDFQVRFLNLVGEFVLFKERVLYCEGGPDFWRGSFCILKQMISIEGLLQTSGRHDSWRLWPYISLTSTLLFLIHFRLQLSPFIIPISHCHALSDLTSFIIRQINTSTTTARAVLKTLLQKFVFHDFSIGIEVFVWLIGIHEGTVLHLLLF